MLGTNDDAALVLLRHINEKRGERWRELTSDLDFTHSSRKAWALLRKLGTAPTINRSTISVIPNAVATRLLNLSKVPMERAEKKHIANVTRKEERKLEPQPTFSKNFTIDELNSAIKIMKTGKSDEYDIYAEFLKNFGTIARKWFFDLFNYILSSSTLPKSFRKIKVRAMKKPGKNGDDAAHFRSISLLSIAHKFLERIILMRIEPFIDDATPINQDGFRSGRLCVDQIATLTTKIESAFQRGDKVGIVFVRWNRVKTDESHFVPETDFTPGYGADKPLLSRTY